MRRGRRDCHARQLEQTEGRATKSLAKGGSRRQTVRVHPADLQAVFEAAEREAQLLSELSAVRAQQADRIRRARANGRSMSRITRVFAKAIGLDVSKPELSRLRARLSQRVHRYIRSVTPSHDGP